MTRLFFHAHSNEGNARDEEGIEIDDEQAAYQVALENIRSIVAEEARRGLLDLDGRIDVADAEGKLVLLVPFVEAFDLRLPDEGDWTER